MRYGIPLLGDRVAPRCPFADSVLLAVSRRGETRLERKLATSGRSAADLAKVLVEHRVDTLICCGVTREEREYIQNRGIDIIDNVACSADEAVHALRCGALKPGFGFESQGEGDPTRGARQKSVSGPSTVLPNHDRAQDEHGEAAALDCLECSHRLCLSGQSCSAHQMSDQTPPRTQVHDQAMLEAAIDIACETEPIPCRLSELVYFCLEMDYRKLGIAYCLDLEEPTETLVRVLRRFFDVVPVCCKIGGVRMQDPGLNSTRGGEPDASRIVCNPSGQAALLNEAGTDLNILVGACMGVDCIFAQASSAPVTTLFVKDRSLANNPIGAIYSDYYLKEAIRASRGRVRT